MTLTQLEYIVAIDTYKHFVTAAENCFITQPTLSMQVHKLEEELGVVIFDRSKQPVVTTEIGALIVGQARQILMESYKIKEIIKDKEGQIEGHLRIGVIPTISPYLLPLFLPDFMEKYPKVSLTIEEQVTEVILEKVKNDQLDAGLLVTPLGEANLQEIPLFYEPFVAYVSKKNKLFKNKSISADAIDPDDLLLLNEGHCFRLQVINLCKKMKQAGGTNINYETGSLETLKRLIERTNGITLLPELATMDMGVKQQNMVRYFDAPEPVREVGLVIHRTYVKKKLIQLFMDEILAVVPEKMRLKGEKKVVNIK